MEEGDGAQLEVAFCGGDEVGFPVLGAQEPHGDEADAFCLCEGAGFAEAGVVFDAEVALEPVDDCVAGVAVHDFVALVGRALQRGVEDFHGAGDLVCVVHGAALVAHLRRVEAAVYDPGSFLGARVVKFLHLDILLLDITSPLLDRREIFIIAVALFLGSLPGSFRRRFGKLGTLVRRGAGGIGVGGCGGGVGCDA